MATNKIEQPFKPLRVVFHPGVGGQSGAGEGGGGRMGTRRSVRPQRFQQGPVTPAGTVVLVTHWCVCVFACEQDPAGRRWCCERLPHPSLHTRLHSLSLLALNSLSSPSTSLPCSGASWGGKESLSRLRMGLGEGFGAGGKDLGAEGALRNEERDEACSGLACCGV